MKEFSIEERLAVCLKCPIYVKGLCNSNLWINPKTDEISTYAKIGYVRGCGCVISYKARNIRSHCVAQKW